MKRWVRLLLAVAITVAIGACNGADEAVEVDDTAAAPEPAATATIAPTAALASAPTATPAPEPTPTLDARRPLPPPRLSQRRSPQLLTPTRYPRAHAHTDA